MAPSKGRPPNTVAYRPEATAVWDYIAAQQYALMVTVLRRLNGWGVLEKYPNLSAYVARGEARPAYKRAFDAQLGTSTTGPRSRALTKSR